MHLVSADSRVLEGERVCQAIDAIGAPEHVVSWANRFGLLGEPNRLAILLAIDRAGPISVTDVAVATGLHDSAVSQVLRLLRAAGMVVARRDGRIVRYELADEPTRHLLEQVAEHSLVDRDPATP